MGSTDDMAEKAKSFIWQASDSTVPLGIPAMANTPAADNGNVAEEGERMKAVKRLKKVRAAMKKLPSKEERSEGETAKYRKLKKEAMRLQTVVSPS